MRSLNPVMKRKTALTPETALRLTKRLRSRQLLPVCPEQRKKIFMNGSWTTMITVRNMRARSFTVIWNTNLPLMQIQAKFLNGIWTLYMTKADPYGRTSVHRDFCYLFKSITWRTGQLIQYQVKYAGLVRKGFQSDLLTSHKPGVPAVFWAG